MDGMRNRITRGAPQVRRRLLGACCSAFMLLAPAAGAESPEARAVRVPEGFRSPLANRDQVEVEKLALAILAEPGVQAARELARRRMQANPIAKTRDGRARLERALDAWLTYLTVQEANADPARPKVVWSCDLADYEWFGHRVPASGAAIDNPDNVYRHIPVDGESRYEIRGRLRPMHAAQFSFQLVRHADMVPRGTDLEVLGMLTSRDLEIAADGAFVILVDPEAAGGRRNHIQTRPGALLRLILRDTLMDWKQNASELEVRRIAGPEPGPAPTRAELAARVAAQFPDYVSAWLNFIRVFNGDPPANQLIPPYGRSGGWGWASTLKFELADDEAIVFTIEDGGAEYAAVQATDGWMIGPDPQQHLASYTTVQAAPNADGTYTFVLSPRDPGAANWLDVDGVQRGWVLFRWQGMPRAARDGSALVRSWKKLKRGELDALLGGSSPRISPTERTRQLDLRRAEWQLRIAAAAEPRAD